MPIAISIIAWRKEDLVNGLSFRAHAGIIGVFEGLTLSLIRKRMKLERDERREHGAPDPDTDCEALKHAYFADLVIRVSIEPALARVVESLQPLGLNHAWSPTVWIGDTE